MDKNKKNADRITLMIDSTYTQKIRKIQADRMLKDNKSVSFSSVCNELFKKALK